MPLIELKTYKPVCDICGRTDSTWTNVAIGEESSVVPAGWLQGDEAFRLYLFPRRAVRHDPTNKPAVYLVCGWCQKNIPDPVITPAENDSRV